MGKICNHKINNDILCFIIQFCDNETLINFIEVSKSLNSLCKEALYYRHINNINTDNFLIKNSFNFIIEDDIMIPLFNYITSDKSIVIAGGYTTYMFFEKEFKPESDIDFFINDKNKLIRFVNFIAKNYHLADIQLKGKSVIDIKLSESKRSIQIIYSDFESIGQLLDSFDFSYCKTAYHKGISYITYDALLSKNNKVAITYSNPMDGRIEKAEYFDLKVLNHDYNVILYPDSCYYNSIDEEFNNLTLLDEKINFLSDNISSLVNFKRHIHAVNKIDIMSSNIKFYMDEYQDKIKAEQITTKFGMFYKRLTYVIPSFKIKGKIIHHIDNDKISIVISDSDEIKKLRLIKEKIFKTNFTFRKLNNRILASKDDINMMNTDLAYEIESIKYFFISAKRKMIGFYENGDSKIKGYQVVRRSNTDKNIKEIEIDDNKYSVNDILKQMKALNRNDQIDNILNE